jgi:4,4'-diaponeurosporenoate glycosyltransferase
VAVGALLALAGAASGADLQVARGDLALWMAAWVVVAVQLRSVLRRLGSFRWWAWLLFPVPLVAFDLVFARSAVRTVVRRSVRWRGREVRLDGRGSAEKGA